jgi:PKD domain/REJ domain
MGIKVQALAFAALAVVFVGCVQQPVANAGAATSVTVGDVVLLDGTKSTDPGKGVLTFAWTLASSPKGSQARLESTNNANPSFIADQAGDYKVTLIVSNKDSSSEPSSVTITATAGVPIANCADSVNQVGTVVTLDGSASHAVGNSALTYKWTVTDPMMAPVVLSNGASSRPTFRAELVGDYAVSLVVNDGNRDSAADTATVTVRSSISLSAPVAVVVPMVTAGRGQTVTLNGSGSYDPDGTALTYQWTLISKPGGSSAMLTDATMANSTFVADVLGAYVASLIVRDASGDRSEPRVVAVQVNDGAPVAVFAQPMAGLVNNNLALDGSGSTDPEGQPLTFDWRFISTPAGALAGFLNQKPNGTAEMIADLAGSYVVELTVRDTSNNASRVTRTVTINGVTTLAVVAGDGQLAFPLKPLSTALVIEARAGTTPVPNVEILWRAANGTIIGSQGKTDSAGRASVFVRTGRVAAAGKITALLRTDPSIVANGNFAVTAGPVALLTLSANPVMVPTTGIVAKVRTADQYGNPTADTTTGTAAFTLNVGGGGSTHLSVFDTAVSNGKGTLTSGGGTFTVTGALVAGEFDILIKETKPSTLQLNLALVTSTTVLPLTLSVWQTPIRDDAEAGLGGWGLEGTPWIAKKGVSSSGVRSLALEAPSANALGSNLASITSNIPVGSGAQAARLTMTHQLQLPSALDRTNKCAAHPTARVTMRNCVSAGCNESQVAPLTGYDLGTPCDNRVGFTPGAGSTFDTTTFDVTDAVNTGFSYPNLLVENSPNPNTPLSPVNWYVDDLVVERLAPGASLTTTILSGPVSAIAWSQANYGNVIYRTCTTGRPASINLRATAVDAQGNAGRSPIRHSSALAGGRATRWAPWLRARSRASPARAKSS